MSEETLRISMVREENGDHLLVFQWRLGEFIMKEQRFGPFPQASMAYLEMFRITRHLLPHDWLLCEGFFGDSPFESESLLDRAVSDLIKAQDNVDAYCIANGIPAPPPDSRLLEYIKNRFSPQDLRLDEEEVK